jgi:hypothetical protein
MLLACLLLCGLAACSGGGGDDPTTSPTTVPEQTTTAAPETVPMPTADPEAEFTTQVVDVKIDPDFDAEALFRRLEGVWDSVYEGPGDGHLDGPLRSFKSFIYWDGKPSFYCGAYEGETAGVAVLAGGRENKDGTVTLYFRYPAFHDEDNNPFPERTDSLQIDLSGIDAGELRIQHTNIWRTYDWEDNTYRCKTLREAGIRQTF